MTRLARLNRPWLHFIALGLLLYILLGQLFPAPKRVVGPLTDARIDTLRQQWFASTGRLPSDQQMARLTAAELDRDMLFQRAIELELHLYDAVVYQRLLRNMYFLQLAEGKSDQQLYEEALDMRLHLGDEVVKRRMIQVMEQLLLGTYPPRTPSLEDVQQLFEARREELRRPVRYSIEQLYFNAEREADIDAVINRIADEGLAPSEARAMSSPFLPGYVFRYQTPGQLARHFGAAFVKNFEAAGPAAGAWLGPIESTYGKHYVFVSELEPERDATLEEVQGQLARELESEARNEALARAIERLRDDFEVRS
ncbi:MAG: peptidylprolyl isomerase [Pseudomonadota bacterium]